MTPLPAPIESVLRRLPRLRTPFASDGVSSGAGALFAALASEVTKWVFARFLGNVTRYEATCGSVTGVVLTMMWLYFASMIVLMGAQIGATAEEFRREEIKAALQ